MRVRAITGLIILFALMSIGCGGDSPAVDVASTEEVELREWTPEELGELGAKLEAEPDRLEAILEENDLTIETYEAAIRKVSENTGESKRYAEAYRRASEG